VLSDALTEPTLDYKHPHNTKIIMSTGKVFIPSMCKVSATMKVSRLSAKAKHSTVLQENLNKCEASSNLNKNLVYLKECSPMLLPAGREALTIVTCFVQVTFVIICKSTIVPLGRVGTRAALS